MKIRNITIDEFGKFKEASFDFGPGLNIIRGDNESGKSTLLAFIRFIFYGVSGKTAGGTVSEREKALSWTGETASGSLTLETDEGRFRIRRSLRHTRSGSRDNYLETLNITDLETGEIVHKGESPGDVFFGVPAAVFESTCFVGQSRTAGLSGEEVGTAIENMLLSGDESLNTQRAVEKIEKSRKTLCYKNGRGGLIYDKTEEQRVLNERLERARTGAAAIVCRRNRLETLRGVITQEKQQLNTAEKACTNAQSAALLRQFDRLHEWEKKAELAAEKLDDWKRTRAHNGFIPDSTFLIDLRTREQQVKAALADYRAALERKMVGDTAGISDPDKTTMADKIQQSGGKDVVCRQYTLLLHTAGVFFKAGLTLLLLGLASLIAGLVLTFSGQNFFLPPLYLAVTGGVLLLFAVISLSCRRAKRKKAAKMLACLGLSAPCPADALAEYIDSCLDAQRRSLEAENDRREAQALMTERRRVLRVACHEAEGLLNQCGVEMMGDMNDDPGRMADRLLPVLSRTIKNNAELSEMYDKTRREAEFCRENILSLRHELSGQNESILRAELPTYAPVPDADEDIVQLRATRDSLRRTLAEHEAEREKAEKELATWEATADDTVKLTLRIEELNRLLKESQLRFDALNLAANALNLAGERIRKGVTPRLRASASALMAHLTDDRYAEMGIGSQMDLTLNVDGTTRPIEVMSGGTKDAAYLSLRLSLLDFLFAEKRPPMMLDEALAQLDDGRAERFLTMLSAWCKNGGQVLLFTCQTRESVLAKSICDYHYTDLNQIGA